MIIFVYGENSYGVSTKVQQLADHFKKKLDQGGYNRDIFNAEEVELGAAREVLLAPPFLATKRFVLTRNFSKWSVEDLAAVIALLPPTTIAVFAEAVVEDEVKKLRPAKLPEDWHEYPFAALAGDDLLTFAADEAARAGLKISIGLLSTLTRRVGNDGWCLANEIKKLAAYANGQSVTLRMLDELVPARDEDKIFELVDALGTGRKREALTILENQLSYGSLPMEIMGMLARQARLILGLSSIRDAGHSNLDDISQLMKLHPFVIRKIMTTLPASRARAEKLLHGLVELDRDIKNGRTNAEIGLVKLVAQAAS